MNPERTLLLVCLLGIAACGKKEDERQTVSVLPFVEANTTEVRMEQGRLFWKETGLPFTGLLREKHPEAGLSAEVYFKDGLRHGKATEWYANGSLLLKGQWQLGKANGLVKEWSEDGLVRRDTMYNKGKIISRKEGPSVLASEQVKQIIQDRESLNKSVWSKEEQAQKYEMTFVKLWDELREAKHDWKVFDRFPFEAIKMAKNPSSKKFNMGIKQILFQPGGVNLSWMAWQKWMGEWKKKYLLIESEWHQESFTAPKAGSPSSLFKIVLHLEERDGDERILVRASINVVWGEIKVEDTFLPKSIAVADLALLRRKGVQPFNQARLLEPSKDFPAHKFVHPSGSRDHQAAPLLVYDLNGDRLPEVVLAGANLVYWNQGGMKFKPEPLVAGSRYSFQSAVLADFNGDGNADMLTLGSAGKPRMYPGTKTGRLKNEPVVSLSNKADVQIRDPQCITCGDIDGDGDLDAYIGQYAATYQSGKLPTPYYDANDGHPAFLLINDGSGFFTDRTLEAGLGAKRKRRTYSASFVDLDSDNDLDLMVVSDFAGLDLYMNNSSGRFVDVTDTLGEAHYSFGMSHALSDFDGDGNLDIYMVGMGSTTARRLEGLGLGRSGFEGIQKARMKMGYGNRLLLGRGDGMFAQPEYNDRVARTGWAWGCTPWDFDNDGDRDLYVANGFLSAKSARDYCTQYWRHDIYYQKQKSETLMQMVFDKCQAGVGSDISWNGYEHNVLLVNTLEKEFPSVGFLMGIGFEFDSRSVVSADLDLDGRVDLLVVERVRDELVKAYVNKVHLIHNKIENNNHWIGFHLTPADLPMGATVRLQAGGKTQMLPIVSGDSYNSQHPLVAHFGLAKNSTVTDIIIKWPSGEEVRLKNPKTDEYHHISIK